MTNHLSSIIGAVHTFFQVEDDIFIDDSLITNRTFTHYNSFILTDDCLSGWTVLSACGATKTVIGKKKKKSGDYFVPMASGGFQSNITAASE